MAELDLDAIEVRDKRATEGPWLASHNITEDTYDVSVLYSNGIGVVIADCRRRSADAEFIAYARTDIPALVAEVRRLRTLRVEIEQGIGGPATIKFWRDNVLRFNGVDYSALMERDEARAEVRRLHDEAWRMSAAIARVEAFRARWEARASSDMLDELDVALRGDA